MSCPSARPRILFVSSDVIFIPDSSEHRTGYMVASSAGSADDLANLIVDLYDLGVDVHVAKPDYRQIFTSNVRQKQSQKAKIMPVDRIHLTEDRAFFYSRYPDSNYQWENIKISLAFQREVFNQIIPRVQPDLIHCHDWMTGLIPPMAKAWDIPCLFTVHNCHSAKSCLAYMEDMGIDAAGFWQNLYYDKFPTHYEQTRDTNPADFLLSGIFAASFVETPTPARLQDIFENQNGSFEASLRQQLAQKWKAGYAFTFNQLLAAKHSIDIYERILQRSIININTESRKSRSVNIRIAA